MWGAFFISVKFAAELFKSEKTSAPLDIFVIV